MEKRKYFSSRKRGQITVLLKHSDLKQKDIAKEVNVSTQTIRAVRTNLELGRETNSSMMGKRGPFLTNKFLSPPTMPSTHINTIFSYSIFGMFEND